MKLDAGRVALAVISGFFSALLAITLSLARNGRIDVGYVMLLAAVGLIGSFLWSSLAARRRDQ